MMQSKALLVVSYLKAHFVTWQPPSLVKLFNVIERFGSESAECFQLKGATEHTKQTPGVYLMQASSEILMNFLY